MVENVQRKLILIASLLGISVFLLVFNDFRLGLDLQGGTRYQFVLDTSEVGSQEDPGELQAQVLRIVRERVDPEGVKEPIIRPMGLDRIVIEVPGLDDLQGEGATASLAEALPRDATQLVLDNNEGQAAGFSGGGGLVLIGNEQVRYASKREQTLEDGGRLVVLENLKRGQFGTERVEHGANTAVTQQATNEIQNAIENLGELQFAIVALDADVNDSTLPSDLRTSLATEQNKLGTWFEGNPNGTLDAFNRLAGTPEGPSPLIRWIPSKQSVAADGTPIPLADRAVPILVTQKHPEYENKDWLFDGSRLESAYPASDDLGYPAVGFKWKSEAGSDFYDFTDEFQPDHSLAILLNGEVESAPGLQNGAIGQQGIIQGRYTDDEVREMITVLRSGSLPLRPILESQEKIGPSLGEAYIQRGMISGLLALVAIVGFMIFYYRRLGVFAVLSLTANVVLLMGVLSFLQATLTLPGIAGLLLTIGMAVDANILIFDRVREERDNGRNIKQAAKNGFDKAFVTIIDANLTTLITALILREVGTGPVRGFAVTLTVGILTSLFAALVITRVLVHLSLEKDAKEFEIGRWFVTASYDWMGKTKTALVGSAIAIVAGVALFVSLDRDQKLGLDFTGGVTLTFRLAEPMERDAITERVAALGENLAKAEVKPMLLSSDGEGRYSDYRLTLKVSAATDGAEGDSVVGLIESQVRVGLADILQPDPLTATVAGDGTATFDLYFERDHDTDDIAGVLSSLALQEGSQLGLTDVTVTDLDSRIGAYSATAKAPIGYDAARLESVAQTALSRSSDSANAPFRLADPVPSSSKVGAQVVDELRDKAILALVISLFAIVLYIRARFAEYSYGFAAVVALVHDVLITLGVMSVMMLTGLVDVELSLTMIAAFLTIIGYSLNDTIVVFDRVRENRPRMEAPLEEILNRSINQTLSRTVLTSLTTLAAVLILFLFNVRTGNALEGFSFAMVVGVLVGTYSSIFVASPALMFFEKRAAQKAAKQGGRPSAAAA
jgi:SecD/SecF fusion protein